MKVTNTPFEGLLIIEPEVHRDNRGYFFESFNKLEYLNLGLSKEFVQQNMSRSSKNVIRGLHFQRPPMDQAKLVWVTQGVVRDVVVDLRRSHPTFGKTFSLELSSENLRRLFVPSGFAHGFSVMSESADVCYLCDQYYSAAHQGGIHCRDKTLNIDWGVAQRDSILSEKDLNLPDFAESLKVGS